MARGLQNDVFCQIGLVMLVGLASKNAILIVEFAEQLRARGLSIRDAALEAARIRLRPILMTSFAFILGVLPLVLAQGAGQAGRRSVGTTVFGGMIASTLLNLFFIPVLYLVVEQARGAARRPPPRGRRRSRAGSLALAGISYFPVRWSRVLGFSRELRADGTAIGAPVKCSAHGGSETRRRKRWKDLSFWWSTTTTAPASTSRSCSRVWATRSPWPHRDKKPSRASRRTIVQP
jgi:hypothetical protein